LDGYFARKKNGQSLDSEATLSQASSPISTVPLPGEPNVTQSKINKKQEQN
jgi:hypothetical protein